MATNDSQGKKGKNSIDQKDISQKSESETSSSEDEVISNVSLHQGFNPCKCCMCEDCDLRNQCLGISVIEVCFWIVVILAIVITGLITRGPPPMIFEESGTVPSFTRPPPRGNKTNSTGGNNSSLLGKKELIPPYASMVTLPPIIVGGKIIGVGGAVSSADGEEQATDFQNYLDIEFGLAARIVLPNAVHGSKGLEKKFHIYLVVVSILFVCVVVLSMISGILCFVGAFYKNQKYLILHVVSASMTAFVTLALGVFYCFIKGYIQVFLCIVCSCFYVYFAVCSYGLVTMLKAGVYDDFEYDGVIYTYSTVLRAKVKIAPGRESIEETAGTNKVRRKKEPP